jgi:rare lipoprotein A
MEYIVKPTINRLLLSTLVGLGCTAVLPACAQAANSFEIASNVWEEGNAQCAQVTLNGKELIAFRGPSGGQKAEQRAEELADKLQDLLEDGKVDVSKLMPAREGELAAIHVDGTTVLKFEGSDSTTDSPLEQSWKVVNAIRTASGSDTLPSTFLKIAEMKDSVTGIKGASCFSGPASWYGPHFHGKKCADGTRFDMNKLTAAHRFLPLGTKLLVMNRKTGDSCVVRVNDRGPYVGNRVIDLSKGAAQQLRILSSGVAMVDCIVLGNN